MIALLLVFAGTLLLVLVAAMLAFGPQILEWIEGEVA